MTCWRDEKLINQKLHLFTETFDIYEISSFSNFSFISSLIHELSSQLSSWLIYFKMNSSTLRLTWHIMSRVEIKTKISLFYVFAIHPRRHSSIDFSFICHRVYSEERAPNSKQQNRKKVYSRSFSTFQTFEGAHTKTTQRENTSTDKVTNEWGRENRYGEAAQVHPSEKVILI